jgi:E3 ubiquitin-protein ligase UBR7
MYQCLGLASEAEGGCGEDWWHPECLLGLPRDWYETSIDHKKNPEADAGEDAVEEHPVPPGFPDEDDFDTLICYKCVAATPWIKAYADSPGFMTLSYKKHEEKVQPTEAKEAHPETIRSKRKAEDDETASVTSKRARNEDPPTEATAENVQENSAYSETSSPPKHAHLPLAPSGTFSVLTTTDTFRDNFCRCPECYPRLSKYPQLLEAEETYQPPVSEEGDGAASQGTGSLLDRGEAALNAMDRVRAIEGVMAYNHLKDKVKAFLQPFAESGKVVGAEDVRKYFEQLRGDETAIREAGSKAEEDKEEEGGEESRREQSGTLRRMPVASL